MLIGLPNLFGQCMNIHFLVTGLIFLFTNALTKQCIHILSTLVALALFLLFLLPCMLQTFVLGQDNCEIYHIAENLWLRSMG